MDAIVPEDLKVRLDRLEPIVVDTQKRVVQLEKSDAVADVHRTNVENRLGQIEDTLKWLVRLVIGAIALAFIAYMAKGGLVVP